MFSVGIDTTECRRMEKAMKNLHFVSRVFGPSEQKLLQERGFPNTGNRRWIETAAAAFCAKEAFGKAMGTGIRGFRLCEVELLRNESGAPYLHLSGAAAQLGRGWNFAVSATHTHEYASVVILAEKES